MKVTVEFISQVTVAVVVRNGELHLRSRMLPRTVAPEGFAELVEAINQRLRESGERIESVNDLERALELYGGGKIAIPEAASESVFRAGWQDPRSRQSGGLRSAILRTANATDSSARITSAKMKARSNQVVVLQLVADTRPAMWGMRHLADPLKKYSVCELVPPCFDRYARIFHPCCRVEGKRRVPVRWAEVAACTGTRVHALMQWERIGTSSMHGARIDYPDEGTLPASVAVPLGGILAQHTDNPLREPCWLGVWRGYGWDYAEHVPRGTRCIDTGGGRTWDMFRAPLTMIGAPFFDGVEQTAHLMWAADRSWWLSTDIDLNTSYIGGSAELIEAVLGSAALEAWPVEPGDGVAIASDGMNPVRADWGRSV